MATLTLSDFQLDLAAFEVRYGDAFLLWDRAGVLWSEASLRHPELRHIQAVPIQTIFRAGDCTWYVELGQSRIVAHRPHKDLESLKEMAVTLTHLVRTHLHVTDFLRVGLRLIYLKNHPSRRAVSDEVLGLRLFSTLPQILKDRDPQGAYALPEFAVRFENNVDGRMFRLSANETTFQVEFPDQAPPGFESPGCESATKARFMLDIDRYTVAQISTGQFEARSWIEGQRERLRREVASFLEV